MGGEQSPPFFSSRTDEAESALSDYPPNRKTVKPVAKGACGFLMNRLPLVLVAMLAGAAQSAPSPVQQIDLAERLGAGKIRVVNREITPTVKNGVHLAARSENGVAWIDGTDFREGAIEVEVRGKDLFQQSFLGVAFHRKDDATYEAVYVRPFNFRATDPVRHDHAVQYMTVPEFDWPKLREQFPEEFENPVNSTLSPTDWVPLRVVVRGQRVQIFVGMVANVTLEARKLGTLDRGMVGLWVGNNSEGDFSNLRITPAR